MFLLHEMQHRWWVFSIWDLTNCLQDSHNDKRFNIWKHNEVGNGQIQIMGAMLNDQTIGDVEDTMMHESPPIFQHYKPISDITVIRKGVPTHSDDDELVQNSFVSLMESCH